MATKDYSSQRDQLMFFDLPREVRDEIYVGICETVVHDADESFAGYGAMSSAADEPLMGYVAMPSAAPLLVCKQMHNEILPVFRAYIQSIVLQNRVYINLDRDASTSRQRRAGWSITNQGIHSISNIWIRDGKRNEGFTAWWASAWSFWPTKVGESCEIYSSITAQQWDTVLLFRNALNKLLKHGQAECELRCHQTKRTQHCGHQAFTRRLLMVLSRVEKVISNGKPRPRTADVEVPESLYMRLNKTTLRMGG